LNRRGTLGAAGWKVSISVLAVVAQLGCAIPRMQQPADARGEPSLGHGETAMADGYRLPTRVWEPSGPPAAVAIGLHGFNDYHAAFDGVGPFLAQRGILVLAYDQRGFGATEQRGIWPGTEQLVSDLRAVTDLVRRRYPGTPLYVIGESMGGAVAMVALAQTDPPAIDGLVLVAPAVWSPQTMNPIQFGALWIAAHTVPGLKVSGRGLGIRPSDNQAMLDRLGRDPLVIKDTRIDALWGMTLLMDRVYRGGIRVEIPTLLLYGANDQIIPKRAFCELAQTLPESGSGSWRVLLYPEGYHMLTRDLKADIVLNDLAAWLLTPSGKLPSGLEVGLGSGPLEAFCGG